MLFHDIDLCHKKLGNISKTSQNISCCILTPIEYDFDIFTNNLIPIYGCKNPSPLSRLQIEGEEQQGSDLDIDYSQLDFPNELWIRKEAWEIFVKTIAVIPLVVIAILGNLLVIKVVLKSKALRENPVNLFIFNMSIADLFCALFFPWIFLLTDLNQFFVLGSFVCKCEGFFLVTLMLASVFTLSVISFDRLVAIVFPFNIRLKPKCAKWIIYGIWIIACAISIPLIVWKSYKERQWKNFFETYCTEDFKKMKNYWVGLVIVLVWVPLGILIVSYTAIIIKLDTLEKRQRDQPISQVKHKSKVIRMLFLVVLVFSICWIPFTSLIFIRNNATTKNSLEVTDWYRAFFFVSRYLMFLNNALNPIIYGLMNDNFKRELRRHGLPSCLKKQKRIEVSEVLGNGRIGIVDQAKALEKTKLQKMAGKYGIVLSTTSSGIPSLNSYDRRNSALVDLGLPVPIDSSSSDSLIKLNYELFNRK